MGTSIKCPKCQETALTPYCLPRPAVLHWILNPVVAINELVLGQRVPRLMYICKACKLPYIERQYIPCPSCHAVTDGRTWSCRYRYGFGNWLGLVCPACGRRIPCLWNLTSLLVLWVTCPLWIVPYHFYFRDRVVARPVLDLERWNQVVKTLNSTWFRMGLPMAAAMWILDPGVPCLWNYHATGRFDASRLLVGAGECLITGLLCGTVLHWMCNHEGGRS